MEFLWKFCVSSTTLKIFYFARKKKIFQNFAHSLKKIYINIISGILPYFAVDSGMKLFFVTLLFFISKKMTPLLQSTNIYIYIYIYIYNSFFIFSILLSPFLYFLSFSFYLQFQESDYVFG